MRIQSAGYRISYAGKAPSRKGVQTISAVTNVQKSSSPKNIERDIFKFTQTDKSLNPEFLRDLSDLIKGIPFKRISCLIVKDKLVEAMGYKHPELLKLVFVAKGDNPAAYDTMFGIIKIREYERSDEETISMIRHELEHMNQGVKLYKALGKEKFLKASLNVLKQKFPDATMAEVENSFNEHFYETMAKDADITNFDAEKYYKAQYEYPLPSDKFSLSFKYYNNLLEKDAYAVEKKVLKALGKEPVVAADFFPENYETMISLMKNSPFPEEAYDLLLYELNILVHLTNIKKSGDIVRFLKVLSDIKSHKVAPKDMEWWNETAKDILHREPTLKSLKEEKKCHKAIESFLREGQYTVQEVLNNL